MLLSSCAKIVPYEFPFCGQEVNDKSNFSDYVDSVCLYKTLSIQDDVYWYYNGPMLPCNVIIQELEKGNVEVVAVDPMASMKAVENGSLAEIVSIS